MVNMGSVAGPITQESACGFTVSPTFPTFHSAQSNPTCSAQQIFLSNGLKQRDPQAFTKTSVQQVKVKRIMVQ